MGLMRNIFAVRLFFALMVLAVAGAARAQPGLVTLESIEALVLNASRIAIAKIKSFTLSPSGMLVASVTFSIEEAIKGSDQQLDLAIMLPRPNVEEWHARS